MIRNKRGRLLAQSKYGGADQLPPIVFTTGRYGSDVGGRISALAQMWQQNLHYDYRGKR